MEEEKKKVASACPLQKSRYELCFQKWYTEEFITGKTKTLTCEPEFVTYQACVKENMKKMNYEIYIEKYNNDLEPTDGERNA